MKNPLTGEEFKPNENPFEAGSVVSPEIAKITQEDWVGSIKPKKPVGLLSSIAGATTIDKQLGYLNGVDSPTPSIPVVPKTPEPPKPQTDKAYFENADGQTAEYTQDQLKDPQVQEFLKSKGYVPTKFAGVTDTKTSELESNLNEATKKVENLTNDFLSYNVDADPQFQKQAENIKADFAKLTREMEQTNYQRKRAFETLGLRTGATQYAGGIQMGIEGEELNQANERIADIHRQEASAISQARQAFETGKFNKFNQQVDALKDLREMKSKELENYNKKIVDFSKKLQDERKDLFEREKFEFQVKNEQEKIALDLYKFETEQKGKGIEKPMVVAPGSSIYDPSTGEFIGTAPKPAETKAPEIQKWGGKVHQWNPGTQSWETLGSEKEFGGENSQTVIDWANQVANGTRKFSDVPEELKTSVNSAIAKLPPKQKDVFITQTKIKELEGLLSHKGLNSSVGPTGLQRIAFKDLGGAKADFIGKVQRLLSENTLKSLIDAKAQGATFGALSEGELKILQSAASNIGTWAVKDDNGNIVGYNVSEKAFKEELNRIKTDYENLVKETSGQTSGPTFESVVQDFYNNNPSQRQFIDSLDTVKNPSTGQPLTNEEKQKILEPLGIKFSNEMGGGSLAKVAFSQKSPENSKGGQCGYFTRRLVDFPSGMGDFLSEKKAFVRKVGISPKQWAKTPKVGDVVFTDESSTYGHVAVVNEVLPDGQVRLTESNYNLDEKVHHDRVIAINSPAIFGVVRGTLKA